VLQYLPVVLGDRVKHLARKVGLERIVRLFCLLDELYDKVFPPPPRTFLVQEQVAQGAIESRPSLRSFQPCQQCHMAHRPDERLLYQVVRPVRVSGQPDSIAP